MRVIVVLSFCTLVLNIMVHPYKLGIQSIPCSIKKNLSQHSVALLTDSKAFDELGKPTTTYVQEWGISGLSILLANEIATQPLVGDRLANIDILLVDIADFGMYNSPSIQALASLLFSASRSNTQVIVLDRPNPCGYRMEGPVSASSEHVFLPIPLRHGMTAGELAWFCNMHYLARPVNLHVVQMSGYDRKDDYKYKGDWPSLFDKLMQFTSISCKNDVLQLPICGTKADWQIFIDSLSACGITVSLDYSSKSITCCLGIDNPSNVALCKAARYIVDFLKVQSVVVHMDVLFDKIKRSHTNDGLVTFFTKARSSFMYTPFPLIGEFA